MTFTFDAWQFFRFAQPELINAYLCVCCWAVDALYLPENKRQRALCRRTPCAWYTSMSTRINASRRSSSAYWRFFFFFFFLTWQKQSWYFVWKKWGIVNIPLYETQSQCYSITCSWIQFLFLPLGVHAAMNTAGDCMCFFTKLVHSTHRHLVRGGCSQDNLFRLARLKAVIYHERYSPSSDGIPTAAAVQRPLRLSPRMDHCDSLQSGRGGK